MRGTKIRVMGMVLALAGALQVPAAVADSGREAEWEAKFQEGMQALEEDRLQTAIAAFHSILSENPRLHRARLELALAYYRALRYEEARRLAREVLEDPATPQDVRLTIRAFLAQVEREAEAYARRHAFKGSVSFGAMHDSNVNVGPSSDLLEINGRILRVVSGLERSDSALVLHASLSHRFNPHKTFTLNERVGSLEWLTDFGLYHRGYRDEGDYDLSVLTASTGPSWSVLHHWRAAVSLQADQVWLGGNQLALFTGIRPHVSWQFRWGEITADAAWTRRDYARSVDSGREGTYRSVGLAAGCLLARGRVAGQLGVRRFDFDADAARYGNEGWEIYAGGIVQAGAASDLYARAAWKELDYDGPEPLYGRARDERERRAVVGFRQRFTGKGWKGWSWNLSFAYIDNDSNLSLYDYDRRQIGLTVSKTWL